MSHGCKKSKKKGYGYCYKGRSKKTGSFRKAFIAETRRQTQKEMT